MRPFFFCSALWAASFGIAADLPFDLSGDAPVVWLPASVSHMRVLEDGRWIFTGSGPKPAELGEVTWLSSDDGPAALGTEPVPEWIDAQGQAWYSWLEASRRTNWLLQASSGVRLLDLGSTSRGRPLEAGSGRIELRTQHGFAFWEDEQLSLLPRRIGDWQRIDGLRGDALYLTRGGDSGIYRGVTQPGLHPVRFPFSYEAGFGLLPDRWMIQPKEGVIQYWHTPETRLPPEILRLLRELGSDSFKTREAADAALRTEARDWGGRLAALLPATNDPEIRERLTDMLAHWEADGGCRLPKELSASNKPLLVWPRIERLRSTTPGVRHLLVSGSVTADEEEEARISMPPWRWVTIDASGFTTLIADQLRARVRPASMPGSGPRGTCDVLPLDKERWAYVDIAGAFRIFHPRGLLDLELPPPPDGEHNEDGRLLHLTEDGWIGVRRFGRIGFIRPSAWKAARPVEPWVHSEPADELAERIQNWTRDLDSDEEEDTALRLKEAKALLQVCPDFTTGYFNAGAYAAGLNQHEEAVRYFSIFYGLTGFDRAWELRGRSFAGMKRYPEAIRSLNILLDQTSLTSWYRPSYLLSRGNYFLEMESWEEAIRDFELCLKQDPDNVTAWNNIAWLRCTAPDPAVRNADEAIRLGTKACELSEWERAYTIDTLAAAYAEKGDFESAIRFQKRAMALVTEEDPESRFIFEHHLKLFAEGKPVRLPEPEYVPTEP